MQRTIAVILLAAALAALSFSAVLDRHGETATGELLAKATVTYAVTRAAMAALSVVEEVEVSIAVVSGKPFKILRPLIDLLDRFSSVLFFAIASLGLLKILTWLFGTGAFSILYGAVIITFLLLYFTVPPKEKLADYWPWRYLLMASVVRFAFVLIVGMNALAHAVFLEERQTAAMSELEARAEVVTTVSGEIAKLSAPEEDGWFGRFSPTRMLNEVKAKGEAVVDSVIDVTVLFLLQAVVIPLAFLWLVLATLRRLAP